MSNNCISCVAAPRTGSDLLCDNCRSKSSIVSIFPNCDCEGWIETKKQLIYQPLFNFFAFCPYCGKQLYADPDYTVIVE